VCIPGCTSPITGDRVFVIALNPLVFCERTHIPTAYLEFRLFGSAVFEKSPDFDVISA
jgi:hypothetical protein